MIHTMASKRKISKTSDGSHEKGNKAGIAKKPVVTIDSLPPEVLEIILELANDDVKSLKTFRLISKSWNEVCCRILCKVAAVPMNAREDCGGNLEKFKDLILDRHDYFPSDWPNPFQNLKILEASLVTTPLVRFVQSPKYKITTLEIVHDTAGFDPKAFQRILEQHSGELCHLKIRGNSDSIPFLTLTERLAGASWRSLKSLTLIDNCTPSPNPCRHVEFLIPLVKILKLKQVDLEGDLTNITRIFVKKDDCWDQLIRLELTSASPPSNVTHEQIHEYMNWALEIQFHCLVHLNMWFREDDKPEQTSEQYTPYLLPLIQQASRIFTFLGVDFISLSSLPSLPKLKHLSCALKDGDRILDITELKFPSLTSLNFDILWTEVPIYEIPKDSESNEKVTALTTFWRENTVPAAVTKELLWTIVGDQFPNLNTIYIQKNVTSSTLHLIRKRLPKLRDVNLSSVTASELLGTSFCRALTAKGWPYPAFGNSALLDMTELTHLRLGNYVNLTRDLIAGCLGKLPKIKSLKIIWNNSLKIADVLDHLGHIPNLTIFYKSKEQKRELEKLTKTMKGLRLVKGV